MHAHRLTEREIRPQKGNQNQHNIQQGKTQNKQALKNAITNNTQHPQQHSENKTNRNLKPIRLSLFLTF
jgi:hypothetical protein